MVRRCVSVAALAILVPGLALGQTVTIETTLRERGYANGIVLQGQGSASVYVPLPRMTQVRNGRIVVEGRIVAPTLQRGSVSVEVSGLPVDGFAPERASGPAAFRRTIALGDGRLAGLDALNVRFDSELRASADPCADDLDTGNSVVIFPDTRIAYDVGIDAVRSIADAIAILPHQALVLLPDRPKVATDVAAAAIQVAALLTLRGHAPRIEAVRGSDPVAIRIAADVRSGTQKPSIRLERGGGRLDIVVDSDSDFVALGRLLQTAPVALTGERVEIVSLERKPDPVVERFQPFATLPPVQRIRRFGEWRLNFPLVAGDGRLAEAAVLKLFVAPDWSNERAIVTVYLNEQIVAALRANTGEDEISVPLPASMLRFSNTLRIAIERGGSQTYCAATDRGQAAQLLSGSGLMLRENIGAGFLRVAAGFSNKGEIALPLEAAELPAAGAYLRLAAKILASFSSRVGELSVVFGAPSATDSRGVLFFEIVGQAGLVVAAADQIDRRDIRVVTDSSIAVLTAEPDGRTMRVQLADIRSIPNPTSLYLGGGSKALVDDRGVVWQAGARVAGPTLAEQLQSQISRVLNQRVIAGVLIALVILILLFVSRAVIKSIFRSLRRAKAE